MNTKLLRQKILDLAIRGKLTEQKKSDGTTRDLLKQISSNVILSNAKNPGKSKNTPKEIIPLDKTTAPFEIPENWEWVRLGDICSINQSNLLEDNLEVAFVPMTNVAPGYANTFKQDIRKWGEIKKGFTHFANGDVAVAKITPCFENRKSVLFKNLKNGFGAGTTELHILRPQKNVFNSYVLWFVKTDFFIQHGIGNFSGAVGQQRVGKDVIANVLFPLPPLAEQQRIVTAIENAFAEITEIENNQELLKKHIKQGRQKILDLAIRGKLTQQLKTDGTTKDLLKQISSNVILSNAKNPGKSKTEPKQIVPLDKTTAPFDIPENWEWVKLGDVLNEMQSTSPRGETFKYIDIDSIDNVACRVKSPKIIETKNAPSRASRFTKKGDVLFSMVRPYLKNIAKVIEDDCIASTGFYVCSPKGIVSDYCYYLMISNYVVDGLNQFMKGDNSPSISSKNIIDWFIPLPPLAEQQRIVATIEQAFAEFDAICK